MDGNKVILNNRIRKPDLNRILYLISYVLFFTAFLYLCYIIRTRSWTWLDSDMSSELILAKMLNEEGRILTPNWYYGTELRILYYTQISAFLFNFTDSWYSVRVYTNIIMIMIMLVSIWCLTFRLKIHKYFPIIGLILILPFSLVYYKFILYGQYYIPCIATSFFGAALMLHYMQSENRRTKIIILCGSVLLAVVSSLIGYRQAVMFYAPAFMGAVIMRSRDYIRISLADLIGAGIGCMINSLILIRIYPVEDWNNLSFARFSLERFIDTLWGVIGNLGYREDRIGLSSLISNGYSVVLFAIFVYAVYRAIRNTPDLKQYNSDLHISDSHTFITIYSACSLLVLCLLYSLSDMSYNVRYSAPAAVFVIPVVIMFIIDQSIADPVKSILCIGIAILACIVSTHIYSDIRNNDQTAEEREIVAYMEDQGYETGYGTFWHANVLTELSNGRIDMYDWHNEVMFPTVESIDSVWHWLQKVSHETERPTGQVFQIYDENDLYFCPWKDDLKDEDIIYQTATYTIYGYPSYDKMTAGISEQFH